MTDDVKRKALFFLGLAVVAVSLLAASLPRLELAPGLPLPEVRSNTIVAPPAWDLPAFELKFHTFFLSIVSFILVVLLIIMVDRLVRGLDWKQALRQFLLCALIALVAFGLLVLFVTLLPAVSIEAELPPPPPAPLSSAGSVPLGPTPPVLLWLVGLGLAVGTAALGVSFFRARRRSLPETLLLEQEAEKARQALLSGRTLQDVILQCYRQMSLVLQQEQGLERPAFMTTGEFERLLEARGCPPTPVRQLTRLFEAVRYGRGPADPAGEQTALDCLDAIVQFCRRERGRLE